MKPARIILLLVALVAGGLAAFLVTRGGPSPEQIVTTEVVQEAKTQILVAKGPIGVGQRLTAASVEWQDWPEGAIRPEYVTISAMPEAPTQLTNAVARFEFFPGEPIREAKLVRADQGYLSAVLAEGMRGVSVNVAAASSAGGFVVPNDRVDVVLTTNGAAGQQSETILSDVRVLAIGAKLGELGVTGGQEDPNSGTTTPTVFTDTAIATLELNPAQAETLINASTAGALSLALRSVVDFGKATVADGTGTSATVRLIRFGREQQIQAGAQVANQSPAAGLTSPIVPVAVNTAPLAPAVAPAQTMALPQ